MKIKQLNEFEIITKHHGDKSKALLIWRDRDGVRRVTCVNRDTNPESDSPDTMGASYYDGSGRQLLEDFGIHIG